MFDAATTGYRLINGESDGWPGLVLDRYDRTLVLKIYTAAWRNWLESIATLIRARWPGFELVFRCSRNIEAALGASGNRFPTPADTEAASPAPVIFQEQGIRFEAEVWRGQKTGFFLDQRENRQRVEALARGRTVLNAFSFSGGFSLYAARGGALSVTDLDLSQHALASARRNFALNTADPAIAACRHECIQADAFTWLAGNHDRKFDLVVLDPPSLAKRESERAGAIRAYGQLAAAGLAHLNTGGVLVACSCSAHVTAAEFFGAVRQVARAAGRRFAELQTTGHAPDHPATFPEAEYLKGIYLQF
jgi:23S rRNA (cytosine1962-C5)-methyltransferase